MKCSLTRRKHGGKIRIGFAIIGPSGEQFRLTDYLGQGFFGEVYRAVGLSSGRIVAVKLIPVGTLQNPTRTQTALLNEIRTTSKIVHPNVVQVLHVSTDPSAIGPYLVMEYVSGGTVARKLVDYQRSAKSLIPMPRSHEMMIDVHRASGPSTSDSSIVI